MINGRHSHSYLHEPKFHLLLFAQRKDSYESIRKAFENEYQGIADQQFFVLDEPVSEVFGSNEPFLVLLRPDNHIAFLSLDISFKRIEAYFREFIE